MAGQQRGTFFPTRLSQFVPNLTFAADALWHQPNKVDFGSPIVTNASGIINNGVIASGTTTFTSFGGATAAGALYLGTNATATTSFGAPYGRTVIAVATSAGATNPIAVKGRDYLGQPLQVIAALNGTTTVTFAVALAYVDLITITGQSSTGASVSIGVGPALGLPYKATNVMFERSNHVSTALGTFIAGVETLPRALNTGDPRGLYNPGTTPDGSKHIEAWFMYDETNLHGNAHIIA